MCFTSTQSRGFVVFVDDMKLHLRSVAIEAKDLFEVLRSVVNGIKLELSATRLARKERSKLEV